MAAVSNAPHAHRVLLVDAGGTASARCARLRSQEQIGRDWPTEDKCGVVRKE